MIMLLTIQIIIKTSTYVYLYPKLPKMFFKSSTLKNKELYTSVTLAVYNNSKQFSYAAKYCLKGK